MCLACQERLSLEDCLLPRQCSCLLSGVYVCEWFECMCVCPECSAHTPAYHPCARRDHAYLPDRLPEECARSPCGALALENRMPLTAVDHLRVTVPAFPLYVGW